MSVSSDIICFIESKIRTSIKKTMVESCFSISVVLDVNPNGFVKKRKTKTMNNDQKDHSGRTQKVEKDNSEV